MLLRINRNLKVWQPYIASLHRAAETARVGVAVLGLFSLENGAPGKIRTPDPLIRSQVLYPAELPVRI